MGDGYSFVAGPAGTLCRAGPVADTLTRSRSGPWPAAPAGERARVGFGYGGSGADGQNGTLPISLAPCYVSGMTMRARITMITGPCGA